MYGSTQDEGLIVHDSLAAMTVKAVSSSTKKKLCWVYFVIDSGAHLNADWGTLVPQEADALGDMQHSRRLYGSSTLEEDVPACWVGSHIHIVCCWAHLVTLQKLQHVIVKFQAELHTSDKKNQLVFQGVSTCFACHITVLEAFLSIHVLHLPQTFSKC